MDDRPLKIFITDPHLKGGGQVRYVTKLARELGRLGHHVTIGCKRGSILEQGAVEAGCDAHASFHYKGGLRPRVWVEDIRTLQAFVREQAPDIFHANGSQDHWINGLANRLHSRKTCVVRTRHNTDPVKEHRLNRWLNRDWTDWQIAVCDAVREIRIQQPVFDSDRMETIHNGVDVKDFSADAEARQRVRTEFGYTSDHVVVGIAARLNIAKGHSYLFEAVQTLRDAHPELRVLILGQGELETELRADVQDRGLDDIAHFAGFRSDIGDCIQAFDVGALPSIATEASSFSLMEQMATSIPMIVSDHGGSKEICRDGKEGFVVPQGQAGPIATALKKLLSDESLRKQYGANARDRVATEFTLALLAQRTIEAYGRALDIHQQRQGR